MQRAWLKNQMQLDLLGRFLLQRHISCQLSEVHARIKTSTARRKEDTGTSLNRTATVSTGEIEPVSFNSCILFLLKTAPEIEIFPSIALKGSNQEGLLDCWRGYFHEGKHVSWHWIKVSLEINFK